MNMGKDSISQLGCEFSVHRELAGLPLEDLYLVY